MLNTRKIKTLGLFFFLLMITTGKYFYLGKTETSLSVGPEPIAEEPTVKKLKVEIKQVNPTLEKTIIRSPETSKASTMTLKKANNSN